MNIINNINAFFICEKAFVISIEVFILKITKFAFRFIQFFSDGSFFPCSQCFSGSFVREFFWE